MTLSLSELHFVEQEFIFKYISLLTAPGVLGKGLLFMFNVGKGQVLSNKEWVTSCGFEVRFLIR